jgi:hypothetical protein
MIQKKEEPMKTTKKKNCQNRRGKLVKPEANEQKKMGKIKTVFHFSKIRPDTLNNRLSDNKC